MATTDYDFNLTRSEIIEQAYIKIGKITPGQTLSGPDYQQGVVQLNTLVKSWATKDIFLWQVVQENKSVTAGNASVALDNAILGIEKCWYKDTNNYDVEIAVKSYRDYIDIVDKDYESSFPVLAAIGFETSVPTLYVYPSVTATTTFYYLAVKRLQDLDTASGTPNIPQRFVLALIYGLATLLADDYSLPVREREYLENKYQGLFLEAQKSDYVYETSTIVEPTY